MTTELLTLRAAKHRLWSLMEVFDMWLLQGDCALRLDGKLTPDLKHEIISKMLHNIDQLTLVVSIEGIYWHISREVTGFINWRMYRIEDH